MQTSENIGDTSQSENVDINDALHEHLHKLNTLVTSALRHYYHNKAAGVPQNVYSLVLRQVEPSLIMATLQYTEGNQSRAARILGVSRRWFLLRCAYYHIHLDPTRPDGYALRNTK